MAVRDRVGLGWRPELGAAIWSNLERIDVLEIIADDWFDASRGRLRALKTLARRVPVWLHGVGLGAASSAPVEMRRVERFARTVHAVEPEAWSEHLAFVRAGGIEIGHLAAPPRSASVVESAAANFDRARRAIGSAPHVENIATLVEPPASEMGEPAWLSAVVKASGCPLLLDLHNLYANSINAGADPIAALDRLPLDTVRCVHIAGGKWIGRAKRMMLDDHLHPVPDPVYALLSELAARVRQPLTVILERDGAYPPFEHLLAELDRARRALTAGRGAQCEAGAFACRR